MNGPVLSIEQHSQDPAQKKETRRNVFEAAICSHHNNAIRLAADYQSHSSLGADDFTA